MLVDETRIKLNLVIFGKGSDDVTGGRIEKVILGGHEEGNESHAFGALVFGDDAKFDDEDATDGVLGAVEVDLARIGKGARLGGDLVVEESAIDEFCHHGFLGKVSVLYGEEKECCVRFVGDNRTFLGV